MNTIKIQELRATAPEFIPMKKIQQLRATAPEFIPIQQIKDDKWFQQCCEEWTKYNMYLFQDV